MNPVGRLTRVTTAAAGVVVTNYYSYCNCSSVDAEATVIADGTTKTYYVYSAQGQLLVEEDWAAGTSSNQVYFNGQLVATHGQDEYVRFVFKDHLGSTRSIATVTPPEGGNNWGYDWETTAVFDYNPFGDYASSSNQDPQSSRARFTGKEREDNGLDYFGARYYDSNRTQRWISPDPITSRIYDPPSLNKYAYVRNDPMNRIDPNGRQDQPFTISITVSEPGYPIELFNTRFDVASVISELAWLGIGISGVPLMDAGFGASPDPGGSGGVYNSNAIIKTVIFGYKDMVSLISKNNLSGQSDQLITCIAFKESGFNAEAKNPDSSASGLMQITRAAAIDIRPTLSRTEIDKIFEPGGKIFDANYNVATGSAYLGVLMDRKKMDLSKALAAYGTGEEYAKKVLDCEAGLKAVKPGDDPYEVLRRVC
jgi:RHS repeat-associated protein